jgi:3-phenylpropionate/trans-cinnamate dioxygenase ferredoxin subunit
MLRTVVVANVGDIPEGQARVFEAGELRLAVCHVAGEFFAVDDTCTHDDGPLGEGCLIDHQIECPRHGARFDVRTGQVTRMPAAYPVRAYRTSVRQGQVVVEVDES